MIAILDESLYFLLYEKLHLWELLPPPSPFIWVKKVSEAKYKATYFGPTFLTSYSFVAPSAARMISTSYESQLLIV